MSLRIDVTGLPAAQVRFAVSPLAELIAMLHVLAATGHHPQLAGWAGAVRGRLSPGLSERLEEAEFLWRSSRAGFLLPAEPRRSLEQELDDVDRIEDETYVTSALVTTCGSSRVHFGDASALTDPAARERVLEQAQARGTVQEAFAERLLADPGAVRVRVRETLEWCAEAFFDAEWPGVAPRLAADARAKSDLRERKGIGPALEAVCAAVTLVETADGASVVVDKLQDNATSARAAGLTLVPSIFGSPHLFAVHTRGWKPVLQYPVIEQLQPATVPLDAVAHRLDALAHPVRLRLVRTLARGPHTTSELAHAWQLTTPEVSRHLAVLRKAGLLTAQRRGRYVHYTLDLTTVSSLGTDLLAAILR